MGEIQNNNFQDVVLQPITQYLVDDVITEIMVNKKGAVLVEKENILQETETYLSGMQIESIIRVIASNNNFYVNTQSPSVSAKVGPYGFRFQGIIPPASEFPVFCIRKQRKYTMSIDDLVACNTMSDAQKQYLQNSVALKKNILIAGGTGSGKTTLVNALLSDSVLEEERIVVIEDTPELYCNPANGFRLLTSKEYSYTNAIKDVLRMRPDRIIIGELRDSAALDLLKAWNTGHNGGISTLHANSAVSALERLAQLIEERIEEAPRALIAEIIDICVYVGRRKSTRKVLEIKEILEYSNQSFITKEVI